MPSARVIDTVYQIDFKRVDDLKYVLLPRSNIPTLRWFHAIVRIIGVRQIALLTWVSMLTNYRVSANVLFGRRVHVFLRCQ